MPTALLAQAAAGFNVSSGTYSLLLALAALAILPFLLTMVTSFAKLVVVGSILRQALGTQHIPPTSVITGLALILTIHIMYPYAAAGWDDYGNLRAVAGLSPDVRAAIAADARRERPSLAGIDDARLLADPSDLARQLRSSVAQRAAARAAPGVEMVTPAPTTGPTTAPAGDAVTAETIDRGIVAMRSALRPFLSANTSPRHLGLFRTLQRTMADRRGATLPADDTALADLTVLVPAFVLTELGEAFLIGFLVFVPFLVIDLVVSAILLALGMQMLNPVSVTLPLKLLVFVLMDGWTLILRGLVLGYA